MSNPLTPLSLSAAALTVLHNRGTGALSAIKSALDSERNIALVADAGENLAQPASSGGAIPRGQIINILV